MSSALLSCLHAAVFCVPWMSDVDLAYIVRFKNAFTKELNKRKENMNLDWLKVASALDPPFKDLRYLPRADTAQVRQNLMIC